MAQCSKCMVETDDYIRCPYCGRPICSNCWAGYSICKCGHKLVIIQKNIIDIKK